MFSEWGPAGTDQPAGFDRGSGAVFVRLARLPPGAWYVYFLHEVAHVLSNALARDGLMAAQEERVVAMKKGWNAIVARSSAAFATLEGASAR